MFATRSVLQPISSAKTFGLSIGHLPSKKDGIGLVPADDIIRFVSDRQAQSDLIPLRSAEHAELQCPHRDRRACPLIFRDRPMNGQYADDYGRAENARDHRADDEQDPPH